MGGFVLAFAHIDHEKHVGGKPESIPELFYGHTDVDDEEIARHSSCQVNIDRVGQVYGNHHGPEPEFESVPCRHYAAQDATEGEGQDADGTIHEADLSGGKCEPAHLLGIEQEGRCQFHQLCLAKPVKQQERDDDQYPVFAEKEGEGPEKFGENTFGAVADGGFVGHRVGQHQLVVYEEEEEHAAKQEKGDGPSEGNVSRTCREVCGCGEIEFWVNLYDCHHRLRPVILSDHKTLTLNQ